jgi:hypothetical protein
MPHALPAEDAEHAQERTFAIFGARRWLGQGGEQPALDGFGGQHAISSRLDQPFA